MKTAYAAYKPETMARAAFVDAGISFKVSVEIAKKLKGMMSDKAEQYLQQVIAKKQPVPFTRATNGVGHRKGNMASGRYPVKAATQFLALVKLCVANAENKGLGTPLRIVHLAAQRASSPYHYGRQRGITMKRTHLDIVMIETDESKRGERKQKRDVKKTEAVKAEKPAATDVQLTVESKTPEPKKEKPEQAPKKEASANTGAGMRTTAKPKTAKPKKSE